MAKPEEQKINILFTSDTKTLVEACTHLSNKKTWFDVRVTNPKPLWWSLTFNIDFKLPPKLLKKFNQPQKTKQKK